MASTVCIAQPVTESKAVAAKLPCSSLEDWYDAHQQTHNPDGVQEMMQVFFCFAFSFNTDTDMTHLKKVYLKTSSSKKELT